MNLDIEKNDFQQVRDIDIPDLFYNRYKTGIEVLDDLFEDGILPGSSFTVTAAAGTGKTRFLLQLLEAMTNKDIEPGMHLARKVYISSHIIVIN